MAENKNQHFIPQFYFKNFSSNGSTINLLLKRNGRVIEQASIKNQCARDYFYGPKENENIMTKFENHAKKIMDDLIKIKNINDFKEVSSKGHFSLIYMTIYLQKQRTEHEMLKSKIVWDQIAIEEFINYIKNSNSPKCEYIKKNIELLNSDTMKLEYSNGWFQSMNLKGLVSDRYYLIDLGIHILKNKTSIPFVFGDSPVVLYNQYYRNVKNRGVLGLNTPGLMIFYPLSPDTLLLLIDEKKYDCPWREDGVFEINNIFDVKHINKLQLHNAYETVYFSNSMPQKIIQKYWKQEKRNFRSQIQKAKIGPIYVDGVLYDEVIHNMTHQLPYTLKLSFIQSEVLDDSQYVFRRRNNAIHQLVLDMESGDYEKAQYDFERRLNGDLI